MTKGNVAETFAAMQDDWNPRIAGELNGQQVKLGKFAGEFSWHDHAGEDEVFLVRGSFRSCLAGWHTGTVVSPLTRQAAERI